MAVGVEDLVEDLMGELGEDLMGEVGEDLGEAEAPLPLFINTSTSMFPHQNPMFPELRDHMSHHHHPRSTVRLGFNCCVSNISNISIILFTFLFADKIIFIKAPTPPPPEIPEINIPPPPETKTLVYVLVKKPEPAPPIRIPAPAPTKPSKPEVYFIRYKTPSSEGSGGQYALGGGGGGGGSLGGEYGVPSDGGNGLGQEYGAPAQEYGGPSY
jgi:hypothetical protein